MCADFLTEAETLLLGRLSSIEEKNGLFSLLSFYKEEETEKSIKCSAIPSLYPAFSPHRTSVPYSVDQFPVFPAVVPTKIAILDQTRENPPPPPHQNLIAVSFVVATLAHLKRGGAGRPPIVVV